MTIHKIDTEEFMKAFNRYLKVYFPNELKRIRKANPNPRNKPK